MRMARMVAAFGCVAVLAAGCGGSDGDGAAATTTTTGSSDDGGTTDGGTTDSDLAAAFLAEDCQFLLAGAFLNPLASAVPGSDLDLGDSAARLEAIADKAPDEIQDAMRTLSEGFAQFAEAMQDVDFSDASSFSDPEVQARFQELEEVFDADFEAAGEQVSAYVESNCSG